MPFRKGESSTFPFYNYVNHHLPWEKLGDTGQCSGIQLAESVKHSRQLASKRFNTYIPWNVIVALYTRGLVTAQNLSTLDIDKFKNAQPTVKSGSD